MNASESFNRLTKYRRSQTFRALLDYLLTHEEPLARCLQSCASWAVFGYWPETGASRFKKAFFCKNYLLCPACAVRRSWKLIKAYVPKVTAIQERSPELIPVHIVLTVRNCEDLDQNMHSLKNGWKVMMERKRKAFSDSGRHGLNEWCKLDGGIRAMEVTNKGKGWHSHFHMYGLLHEFMDLPKLSAEWADCNGGSQNISVDRCEDGIQQGLLEVLKYVSKIADLTPEQALHVHRTVTGTRCVDSFGSLRGVHVGDIDFDETTPDDLELVGPCVHLFAKWNFTTQRFLFSTPEDGFQESSSDTELAHTALRTLTLKYENELENAKEESPFD